MWRKLGTLSRALVRAAVESGHVPTLLALPRWLIVLPWLALPVVLLRRPRLGAVALILAAFLAGTFLAVWFFPHYAAPAGVLLVLLHVGLLRSGSILLPNYLGMTLFWLTLAGNVSDGVSHLWRLGRGDFVPGSDRVNLLADLQQDPSRWLVLVQQPPDAIAHIEWAFNGPDQHDAKVVFARSIDAARDRAIIDDFASRGYRVGRVTIDRATLRWSELTR